MGDHIDPMQIRFEKIKYQKNKRRLDKETNQAKKSALEQIPQLELQGEWVLHEVDKQISKFGQ